MTSSPFDEPELYDRIFDTFQFDLPFWKAVTVKGPVLDLGCGTGRVALPLLEMGIDVDGVDSSKPMLDHFARKAAAKGFRPRLILAEMHAFEAGRKYRTIVCAFNAFAHNLTLDTRLGTLTTCHRHLEIGGELILHLSLPKPEMWLEPDGNPVLECEVPDPLTGHRIQVYDQRTKNRVEQTQHSRVEIRILDRDGTLLKSYPSETDVKWCTKSELETLVRWAGFTDVRFEGGFERVPVDNDTEQLHVFAKRTA